MEVKMNYKALFFVIIPFILMLTITIGMPLYKLSIMKKTGDRIIPLVKNNSKLINYITYAVVYIMLILVFCFDFGKMNFVIPYCAVLGLFISTKETIFLPVNGVYKNLLIVGSEIIKYEDIIAIPENDIAHADNILILTTKKTGRKQLTLDNSNEVAEVKKLLLQMIPDLNQKDS